MMRTESDHCAKCRRFTFRPAALEKLPCETCHPTEHFAAVDKLLFPTGEGPSVRKELMLFASPMDRLRQEFTLVDEEGRFYKVTVGNTDRWRDPMEKLIGEMQKLREENRDVLAENARFRRKLEKR